MQRGITKVLTTCCEVLELWWSATGRTMNVVTIREELTVKTQSGTQGGSFLFGRFIQLRCGIV